MASWQLVLPYFVSLSTSVRFNHNGTSVCVCECALAHVHSVRCRSTAGWLRSGRLGPSVYDLVPALSFPTHLVSSRPSLPGGALSFAPNARPLKGFGVVVAPLAKLWAALSSAKE